MWNIILLPSLWLLLVFVILCFYPHLAWMTLWRTFFLLVPGLKLKVHGIDILPTNEPVAILFNHTFKTGLLTIVNKSGIKKYAFVIQGSEVLAKHGFLSGKLIQVNVSIHLLKEGNTRDQMEHFLRSKYN